MGTNNGKVTGVKVIAISIEREIRSLNKKGELELYAEIEEHILIN